MLCVVDLLKGYFSMKYEVQYKCAGILFFFFYNQLPFFCCAVKKFVYKLGEYFEMGILVGSKHTLLVWVHLLYLCKV